MSGALDEGYLYKQGHRRKNWKRRYFVLTGDALRYYTAPNGALKGELIFGAVNCMGTKVKKLGAVLNIKGASGLCEFGLIEDRPLEKKYDNKLLLLAGTDDETAHWMESLSTALKKKGQKQAAEALAKQTQWKPVFNDAQLRSGALPDRGAGMRRMDTGDSCLTAGYLHKPKYRHRKRDDTWVKRYFIISLDTVIPPDKPKITKVMWTDAKTDEGAAEPGAEPGAAKISEPEQKYMLRYYQDSTAYSLAHAKGSLVISELAEIREECHDSLPPWYVRDGSEVDDHPGEWTVITLVKGSGSWAEMIEAAAEGEDSSWVFAIKSSVWAPLRAQLEMVGLGDKFVSAEKHCEHSGWLLARNKVEALGWNRRYVRLYSDTLRRFQMVVYRDCTASIVKAQINLGKFGVNTVTAQRRYSMDLSHYRFRLVPVDLTASDADMEAGPELEKAFSGYEIDGAHEGTSLNQLYLDFASTDNTSRNEWLQAINKVQSDILEIQQTTIRMERAATRISEGLARPNGSVARPGGSMRPNGSVARLGGSMRSNGSTASEGGIPSAAAKVLGLSRGLSGAGQQTSIPNSGMYSDDDDAEDEDDEEGQDASGQRATMMEEMAYDFPPISCDVFIKHPTFGFLKCGRCGVPRSQHFKYSDVGVSLEECGVPELQGSLAVLKPPKGAFSGKDKQPQLQVLSLDAANSWKLRYVQLRGTKLAWYRSEEAGGKAASAGDTRWSLQFDLETKVAPIASNQPSRDSGKHHGKHKQRYYCFVVRSQIRGGQNGRSELPEVFGARSEEERQQWLNAFLRVQQFCYTVQEERIRAAADEVEASHLRREPQLNSADDGGDGDGDGASGGDGGGYEFGELQEIEHKSRHVIEVLTQRALPPPYLDEDMTEETVASLWNPETVSTCIPIH
jgi:hypothetical protein